MWQERVFFVVVASKVLSFEKGKFNGFNLIEIFQGYALK
jgi:hypothetical protein